MPEMTKPLKLEHWESRMCDICGFVSDQPTEHDFTSGKGKACVICHDLWDRRDDPISTLTIRELITLLRDIKEDVG